MARAMSTRLKSGKTNKLSRMGLPLLISQKSYLKKMSKLQRKKNSMTRSTLSTTWKILRVMTKMNAVLSTPL